MKKIYSLDTVYEKIEGGQMSSGGIVLREDREDYFMGFSNSWELGEKDIVNLNLPKMKPGSTIDVQDKLLYRYPKLSLPRQKVDLLKEKYNMKVTRKADIADIHVISIPFLRNLVSFSWDTCITLPDFFKACKKSIEENLFTQDVIDELSQWFKDADKDSVVYINRYRGYYNQNTMIQDWDNKFSDILKQCNTNTEYNKCMYLHETKVEDYKKLVNCKATVAYDTDIINVVDSELAVIDNDQYDTIKAMVTSSDRDNRSLAVEMLANCNIEKSFDVVSGLYWWHYDWIKDTNNWNTVNVKALRSRMKSYEGGHNTNHIYAFNAYLKKLAQDNKLTRFAVDRTRNKLLGTLLDQMVGSKSEVFKVQLENLYIADEIESMINE